MNRITEYIAGITINGMALWTAGYIVGALVGYYFATTTIGIVTAVLLVLFFALKVLSVRRHGRRVNLTLSEELVDKLQKRNSQV